MKRQAGRGKLVRRKAGKGDMHWQLVLQPQEGLGARAEQEAIDKVAGVIGVTWSGCLTCCRTAAAK